MKRSSKKRDSAVLPAERSLFTLEVTIVQGLMTEQFWEQNPVVSRTIRIRGDQTLEDLHYAIFDAFKRFDEHMYEFTLGKKPYDPKAKRYVLPGALEDVLDQSDAPEEDLTLTTIGSLGLKVRQTFGYLFDFGDDWWHEIKVVGIDEQIPTGKYPKVIKRVGKSPPQYPDWDE